MAEETIIQIKDTKVQTQAAAAPIMPVSDTKKKVVRKRPAKKDKTIVVKAKRKAAVARAYIKAGKGIIRVNGHDVNSLEQQQIKDMLLEPVGLSELSRDLAKKADIKINVRGGGVTAQMQAARGAIAKGLVQLSGSEELKRQYLGYDRALLVDDPRRIEPKKFKGPKARARFQTSYR